MKRIALTALLLATTTGATAAQAKPAKAPALRLERVVMMMRHGIRPPTKAQPVAKKYGGDPWPSWSVDPGLLTHRGAAGVKLLGAGDRVTYRGLFGAAGCAVPGAVVLKASAKQRAIDTAQHWAAGAFPGCAMTVDHPVVDGNDPIFHGLDDQPAWFDGQRAWKEAEAKLPRGGLAAETRSYNWELTTLARVLGCNGPTCPLLTEPGDLVAVPHDRPELDGPLDVGSTASQSLLLEYLEGKPMKDVGWGRVTRAEIERMLRFHPLKFKYSNRIDYASSAAAGPIAKEIVAGLGSQAKLTLLAGHDTNIADLGGFFQVHWKVPQYPMDDVPPGGAMGFELWRGAAGKQFVRMFFRAQTMDQLREQRPLTGAEKAQRSYIAIPGCGNSVAPTACSWPVFQKLVASRLAIAGQ